MLLGALFVRDPSFQTIDYDLDRIRVNCFYGSCVRWTELKQ